MSLLSCIFNFGGDGHESELNIAKNPSPGAAEPFHARIAAIESKRAEKLVQTTFGQVEINRLHSSSSASSSLGPIAWLMCSASSSRQL